MGLPVLAPLTVADLREVAEIERVSFSAPWPTSAYTTELTTNRLARYVGARIGGALVGFGGIWLMVDEAHITTMAVLPENRRSGVATALLLELLQEARRGGARERLRERVLVRLGQRYAPITAHVGRAAQAREKEVREDARLEPL